MRNVVVLPQPDGPSRHTTSPAGHGEVSVIDGHQVAEPLGEFVEPDVEPLLAP